MKTEILQPNSENFAKCAELINNGQVVGFPTETVYGLGANAFMPEAVKKVYQAKGRPSDNPLIVHVADFETIERIAYVNAKARIVMQNFMPGSVTMVLPKKDVIPYCVSGGLETVGVRMPDNAVALEFIKACQVPLCAPSANTSTRPSPTKSEHVYFDLNGKIPAIIDGGECSVGVESTVIDLTGDKVRLLRAGGMAIEVLEEKLGKIEVEKSSTVALCPGMKYKHYSPTAKVTLVLKSESMSEKICSLYDKVENAVIFATKSNLEKYANRTVFCVGSNSADYAHNLFGFLRKADELGYQNVICEGVDDSGLGLGVMNRLIKASGENIIE